MSSSSLSLLNHVRHLLMECLNLDRSKLRTPGLKRLFLSCNAMVGLLEADWRLEEVERGKLRWWRCEAMAVDEEDGVGVGECEETKEGKEMMACGRVSLSPLHLNFSTSSLSSLTSLLAFSSVDQSGTALEVRSFSPPRASSSLSTR